MNKRSRHRSKLEVIASVLKSTSKHDLPTVIMFKSGLGWRTFKRYLDIAIKNGWIDERADDSHTRYCLTERGKSIMGMFEEVSKLLVEL